DPTTPVTKMPQYAFFPFVEGFCFGFALALSTVCKVKMTAIFLLGAVLGAIAVENENRQHPRRLMIDPTSQQPQLSQQKAQSSPTLPVSEESRSIENKAVDTVLENDSPSILPSIPEILDQQSTRSIVHETQQEHLLPEAARPSPKAANPIFEGRAHNDKGKAPRRLSSEGERPMNRIREFTSKRTDTLQSPPNEALADETQAHDKGESPSTDLAQDAPTASPDSPAQAPKVESQSSKPEATRTAEIRASEPADTPKKLQALQPTAPQIEKIPTAPESEPPVTPRKLQAPQPTTPRTKEKPAAPEPEPATAPARPKAQQPTAPQVVTKAAAPESKPIITPAKPKAPQPSTSQTKKEPTAPASKSKPEPESR
ncbi:MAG: hypothetical protein L6R42_009779, partial [Xanthoria sp. 1 TBL-2021]